MPIRALHSRQDFTMWTTFYLTQMGSCFLKMPVLHNILREREERERNRGENKTYPPPRGYVIKLLNLVSNIFNFGNNNKKMSYYENQIHICLTTRYG